MGPTVPPWPIFWQGGFCPNPSPNCDEISGKICRVAAVSRFLYPLIMSNPISRIPVGLCHRLALGGVLMVATVSWHTSCGPRPPIRHPGMSGLARDWQDAAFSRDPGRLARLIWDQRLVRAPGLKLVPLGRRLGGRIVAVQWKRDDEISLDRGLLGQLSMFVAVERAAVRVVRSRSFGMRRAEAVFRLAVDGKVRGGYLRSDRGLVRMRLWRRSYSGPWLVSDLVETNMVTLVGLGQSLVDRTEPWGLARAGGGSGPALLAVDDLDQDGKMDLALWRGGTLHLLRWRDGRFEAWWSRSHVHVDPARWSLGDPDQDGKVDLLLSSGRRLSVATGTPRIVSGGSAGPVGGRHRHGRHASATNQCVNTQGSWPCRPSCPRDALRIRSLGWWVANRPPLPTGMLEALGVAPDAIIADVPADLDSDGRLEHLIVFRESRGKGHGAPRLALMWHVPAERMPADAPEDARGSWVDLGYVAGLPPKAWAVAAADLDGDGGQDVIVVTDGGISVYRNLFDRAGAGRLMVRTRGGGLAPGALVSLPGSVGSKRASQALCLGLPGRPLSRVLIGVGNRSVTKVAVHFPKGRHISRDLSAGAKVVVTGVAVEDRRGVKRGTKPGLGPLRLGDATWKTWVGRQTAPSSWTNGLLVWLVCGSAQGEVCRKLAAVAASLVTAAGKPPARVVVSWLGEPTGGRASRGFSGWLETVCTPQSRMRWIGGMLLPRILIYRGGRLSTVLVGSDPKGLGVDLEAAIAR